MAYNGGNADFFEGYIYWAVSSNPQGAGWTVIDADASDFEAITPLLSRNHRTQNPNLPFPDECYRTGGFHEPKLILDASDTSMGPYGTFYLFTSYCHYQEPAIPGGDSCIVRDTWVFRFAFSPSVASGIGSGIQVWRDNGTTLGSWTSTNGRLVFDYDGVTVPGQPVLSYWDGMRDPTTTNVFYRWGAGDLDKDPITARWLHFFNHPDIAGGLGNRFYTQTTSTTNFRRNRWDAPVEVNVNSVYAAYPDPSAANPQIRDTYEPGTWFGSRYNRTGWWAYIPVNPLQCSAVYQGLAIAEAELCPKSAPSISGVTPATGPTGGGTTVTISGSNLDCAASVTFDQSLAEIVSRSSAQLVVRTPPHAAGTITVRAATPNGSATRASAFSYQGGSGCAATATALCLQSNRFKVELVGGSGAYQGYTDPYSNEAGSFWFFDSANTEVVVKVLNGSDTNGNFWVFHGPLTDLQYTLTVTDTSRGTTKSYNKPSGSYCGGSDINAFPLMRFSPSLDIQVASPSETSDAVAGTCVQDSTTACFFSSRFRVRAKYNGVYQRIGESSNQSALFWFFIASRPELMIKMFDGGPLNGRYWLYYGSLTDLSYQLEVTDTGVTPNLTKAYSGSGPFCGGADTNAFTSP